MILLNPNHIEHIFQRELDREFSNDVCNVLNTYSKIFNITKTIHQVRFFAQAVHETNIKNNGKPRLRENLNYSVKGLIEWFSYYRNHLNLAEEHGRNKEHQANQIAIANTIYDDVNRTETLKLGNVEKGDGYKFRGAGILQVTGRYNIVKSINHIHNKIIERVADDTYELYSNYRVFTLLGLAYWDINELYLYDNTDGITQRINPKLPKHERDRRLYTANRILSYFNSLKI